jgi:thiol-disulfide isomerase/thioredoxin
MKTLLLFILGLSASVQFTFARADKSVLGEALPSPTVEYLTAAPDLSGKVTIVEFWATWCPPCRQSIPHLNKLYEKFKDQGLIIIGISKEKKQTVKDFLKQQPMNYFPAIDTNGAYSAGFKITGIPHAILVDKSGKVVWEGHPMSLSEKQIEKLLK